MSGKSLNFEDKKINKSTSYKNKKLFNIHGINVNKTKNSFVDPLREKCVIRTIFV